MGLFGKKQLPPKEQVKVWRQELRKQQRQLQRQITHIDREELKIKNEAKAAAKRGDNVSAKILATEIVRSRKAKDRLYTAKTEINSLIMTMQTNVATQNIMGALRNSAKVMQYMNSLVRIPEISQTMMVLSREMTKAGALEEMVEDTFETLDGDEISDEADDEVDKVMVQLTQGTLKSSDSTKGLSNLEKKQLEEQEVEKRKKQKEEEDALHDRLSAL
ncbi:charged multivesicular body protein [Anaeramoeba ignava]|uniref:Charged multivesicular body protein n=1 Tax=Anaeramoeba ignava TaxID=1746090 RepID=A0A9Q0LLC8_ANAIG|nr:charged multivesicular body protein [Anaeramoeba ignava]